MISQDVKMTVGLAYASGTADRNGTTLDMQGWDGVLMLCTLGAVATGATTVLKAQQGAASTLGDAADLAGSSIAIADDDDSGVKYLDIFEPRERYVRCVVDKDGENACAETVTYIQYRGKHAPTAAHGSGVAGEAHLSPAEGTA